MNSAHEPIDAYLTRQINAVMIEVYNLKRK
jgi:hypothetical protein